MGKFKDLTGMVFGRLTVIERAPNHITPKGCQITMWRCKCSCPLGEECIVSSGNLLNKNTQSCGCLHKESCSAMHNANVKHNAFDVCNDFVKMYTLKGEVFYIDVEDLSKVKEYCWYINSNGYVCTSQRGDFGHELHRLVMNCPDDMVVDHIGGENTRNDNRKTNLRLATIGQNVINRKTSKKNTSGIAGVSWHKGAKKWRARIGINGKTINLGLYKDKNDAILARKEAEKLYFGEYSYDYSQELYKQANESA